MKHHLARLQGKRLIWLAALALAIGSGVAACASPPVTVPTTGEGSIDPVDRGPLSENLARRGRISSTIAGTS
jgi:hypothetical protein